MKKKCIQNSAPTIRVQMFSTFSDVMISHLESDGVGKAKETESKYCYVQLECLDDFTVPPVHFVYVIDTSGSMQGSRIRNAMMGLKASCLYLPEETGVSILSFNDFAKVLHHGKNPYKGHAALEVLEQGLEAYGGTSISNALDLTLQHVETIFQNSKKDSIVVLFMTDGEDPAFASDLNKYKAILGNDSNQKLNQKDLFSRLSVLSGVFTNFVGISTEAASADMAFLAEISNGTFVSVEHGDIVDVMGSLIGLARERIPHKITMQLEENLILKSKELQEKHDFLQDLQGLQRQNLELHHVLEKNKFVPIRKFSPTKLFFEISTEFQEAMQNLSELYESISVTATVHLFEFGTQEVKNLLQEEVKITKLWKVSSDLASIKLSIKNYDCLFLKIQKQWGNLNAKYATLLKCGGYYEESIEEFKNLHLSWKHIWDNHFDTLEEEENQNPTFTSLQIEMQSIGKKIEEYIQTIVAAEDNGREIASLQCRMLSNAATDRNCSMTLDEDSMTSQVATRNSIRQLSQTF